LTSMCCRGRLEFAAKGYYIVPEGIDPAISKCPHFEVKPT